MVEKLTVFNIKGSLVKEDERYVVRDNEILKNLTLSSTTLKPTCSTTGHSHGGVEEYYFFMEGSGVMEVNDENLLVGKGDIVPVQDGDFHRVRNYGLKNLVFICVLGGKRHG